MSALDVALELRESDAAADPVTGPGYELGKGVAGAMPVARVRRRAPESTLRSSKSAAQLCRERGWTVGTRLVGDEGYGPSVIEITAVGETLVLAKGIFRNGAPVTDREASWTLTARDWQRVSATSTPLVPASSSDATPTRQELLLAVDDLWGCLTDIDAVQPETARLARTVHTELWHHGA